MGSRVLITAGWYNAYNVAGSDKVLKPTMRGLPV